MSYPGPPYWPREYDQMPPIACDDPDCAWWGDDTDTDLEACPICGGPVTTF